MISIKRSTKLWQTVDLTQRYTAPIRHPGQDCGKRDSQPPRRPEDKHTWLLGCTKNINEDLNPAPGLNYTRCPLVRGCSQFQQEALSNTIFKRVPTPNKILFCVHICMCTYIHKHILFPQWLPSINPLNPSIKTKGTSYCPSCNCLFSFCTCPS